MLAGSLLMELEKVGGGPLPSFPKQKDESDSNNLFRFHNSVYYILTFVIWNKINSADRSV